VLVVVVSAGSVVLVVVVSAGSVVLVLDAVAVVGSDPHPLLKIAWCAASQLCPGYPSNGGMMSPSFTPLRPWPPPMMLAASTVMVTYGFFALAVA
jgi:hypothetical protein